MNKQPVTYPDNADLFINKKEMNYQPLKTRGTLNAYCLVKETSLKDWFQLYGILEKAEL